MKIFLNNILFILALFVCFSCGQKENTASVAQDKIEMAKGEKANAKKPKKMATNMPKQNAYWSKLGEALNIDIQKVKMMRDVNAANNNKIQALKVSKPNNLKAQIKEIRISEKAEMKKILGEDVYQKKLDWDKTWAKNKPATNTKK